MDFLVVAIGGAFGAMSRYFLSTLVNQNTQIKFLILGTLSVNVLGCFLIGLFYAIAKNYEPLNAYRLLLVVGFLGSFTTFSSISYESLNLLKNLGFVAFSANIICNLVFGLMATYLAINYIK